jgi:SAM-dependent methyltransferase
MASKKWTKEEQLISETFDGESTDYFNEYEKKGVPKTADFQINSIVEADLVSAIDVGSGPGVIMMEMLDRGVQFVKGVDLSPKMLEITQKQISLKKLEKRTEIINGSFLDIEPVNIEAVSLHRVLCCHPDRDTMIQKSIDHNPKLITFTSLRDWKFLRFLLKTLKGFRKLFRRKFFLPYIPPFKEIDKQLKKDGFQIEKTYKSLIWVTKTYKKSID